MENEKFKGDSINIFVVYTEIINLSEILNDFDSVELYQEELNEFFQENKSMLNDLDNNRVLIEKEAATLVDKKLFKEAADLYNNCLQITNFLVKFGKKEETLNIEKFRIKRDGNLKKSLNVGRE